MPGGRPKGIPELESGYVRHEVWKRVADYINNRPKLTLDEIKSICIPIMLKTMPEKLEGTGFEHIFQVIVKSHEAIKNAETNRLLDNKIDAIQP